MKKLKQETVAFAVSQGKKEREAKEALAEKQKLEKIVEDSKKQIEEMKSKQEGLDSENKKLQGVE